jgi:hypothetical protein
MYFKLVELFCKVDERRKTRERRRMESTSRTVLVCAIEICYCFRELDGARNADDAQQPFTFSCNKNNKNMYFMLVELFCAKTIAHTANDRNEWAPGMPRNQVRIEQPRGSVFFWELLGLYMFLHIDSYVYDTLVELVFYINHLQTTKREAWFGTNSASTLYEDRAAKGLRFFVGASGCFIL